MPTAYHRTVEKEDHDDGVIECSKNCTKTPYSRKNNCDREQKEINEFKKRKKKNRADKRRKTGLIFGRESCKSGKRKYYRHPFYERWEICFSYPISKILRTNYRKKFTTSVATDKSSDEEKKKLENFPRLRKVVFQLCTVQGVRSIYQVLL